LPASFEAVHAGYVAALAKAPVDDDTRRAYASRVRGYLAWLAEADVDGDPLAEAAARDWAVRDYRTHLQAVAKRAPATINTVLAAVGDFYARRGLGAPDVRRLDLPRHAPRALKPRDATCWQRSVERWLNPRDRVLALIPFYAGLRIGEAIALDLDDVRRSARKGILIVRSGKGNRYREVPIHADLREHLDVWIDEERPHWKNAETNPALLLNTRGGRLSPRGARDIISAIGEQANLGPEFSSHVLRHTFGTTMIREKHDIVVVAELLGHARLETTRAYSLPTAEDRERAVNSIPSDH
jgi:integrase/recombinase XerC